MRVVVLALALVLGTVACESEESGSVIWTSRCNMKCSNVSAWTDTTRECGLAAQDADDVSQRLADLCVGVLLGEGCAEADASCYCEVGKTDAVCN